MRNRAYIVMSLLLIATLPHCKKQSSSKPPEPGNNTYDPYLDPSNPSSPYYDPYGSGSNADCTTSSGSCRIEITQTSGFGGTLTATVNQPVDWSFSARVVGGTYTNSYSDIEMNTNITPRPPTMQIQGEGTESLRIAWTPLLQEANQYPQGTITISARSRSNSYINSANQSFTWRVSANPYGNGNILNNGTLGNLSTGTSLLSWGLPRLLQLIFPGTFNNTNLNWSSYTNGLNLGGMGSGYPPIGYADPYYNSQNNYGIYQN